MSKKITPLMKQYISIKTNLQDCLLFFRLGDFYELFFEDAKIAAKLLDIRLTKRSKIDDEEIPMCGVPAHASNMYIQKLVSSGNKVAICEQLETPQEAKKRGSSSVVRRDVVRIITPGTIIDDELLDAHSNNYICSISNQDEFYAISWADISVGSFHVKLIPSSALTYELFKIRPAEIILKDATSKDHNVTTALQDLKSNITIKADQIFEYNRALNRINDFYRIVDITSIGSFSKGEISAAGALLEYICYTQKNNIPKLALLKSESNSDFMLLSPITLKNLEILQDISGSKENSLRNAIDYTKTACGSRLIAKNLLMPLLDPVIINKRLDNVSFFKLNRELRISLQQILLSFPDLERCLAKICTSSTAIKDFIAVQAALHVASNISSVLYSAGNALTEQLKPVAASLILHSNLLKVLDSSIAELDNIDGASEYFIQYGFDPLLDTVRKDIKRLLEEIESLKARYRLVTGIPLKISKHSIFGYCIEATISQAKKITDPIFEHKQTLGSIARYTTQELQAISDKLEEWNIIATEMERNAMNNIRNLIIDNADEILLIAEQIATLDMYMSLAEMADIFNYIRPEIDNSLDFIVQNGRHPIIEQKLKKGIFCANDCVLNKNDHIWVITGPNMAGKSTFMRQNAVIALLAQIGSFVPASYAKIGIIDRLFTRIGSGDDISRGKSTFMVEMSEAAFILNNATQKSLIILDEIGRGTSTYDGLAIAASIVNHISTNIGCRTLFATHYHEINKFVHNNKCSVTYYTMAVQEWNNEVVFLYKLTHGVAARSYGIYVASIAGIPKVIIDDAKIILTSLEQAS